MRCALDEATFERWIAAFRGPLIGLCASWGPSWRDAEELALDTFAEAWLGRERFKGHGSDTETVGAWLRGIAFRLNAARARARGRRPALAEDQLGPDGVDGLSAEHLAHTESDEAARAAAEEQAERQALLRAGFAQLSGEHQTVLRMHYLEQTTAREVAALLGVSKATVVGRLYQARRDLLDFAQRAERKARRKVRR